MDYHLAKKLKRNGLIKSAGLYRRQDTIKGGKRLFLPLRLVRFQLAVFFALFFFSNQSFASFLDTLVTPYEFEMSWISKNAIQNGHRLQVAHFHSSQSPDDVLEHFRQLWIGRGSNDMPDFIEEEGGRWKIISTLTGDEQVVVQVTGGRSGATGFFAEDNALRTESVFSDDVNQNSAGSSGFISSMELDPIVSVPRHPLPEPAGSTTVSITHSDEAGVLKENTEQNATTAILVNADSVDSLFHFYRSNMKSSGWALVAENSTRNAAALMYQRNGKKCEISLVSLEEGQTLITLNITG